MKKRVLNLSGKYNTLVLVIFGGILAVTAIALLLIRPAWSDLQQLGQEIPQEQQARDLKEQDYQNLQNAETFFKENAETVEQVNTAVPIAPEVPSILVMLESLAQESGLFLTSFSPQQLAGPSAQAGGGSGGSGGSSGGQADASAAPAGVNTIEVTANFRGSYPSLLGFLYNLERSLRITDVRTLTVSSTANGLEGSITIQGYYVTVDGGPASTAPGDQAAGSGNANQPQTAAGSAR